MTIDLVLEMSKNSNFFNFKEKINNQLISGKAHKGWSGLTVNKFVSKKKFLLDKDFFYKNFLEFLRKDVIIILIKGEISISINKQTYSLNKPFDVLDLNTLEYEKKNVILKGKKNSIFFIISSKKQRRLSKKIIKHFNFLKNIKKINIWGGKIFSRSYNSKNVTLVLFQLKKDFSFFDKGHYNEQITWLVEGDMKFNINGETKDLSTCDGVNIGEFQKHGGFSTGAVGFDVFYPKRLEKRYLN